MTTIEDFAKGIQVVPSSRSHVLLLIGFFGASGGGKTVTALITATGLVGPEAKIGIVDTEQKRSGMAADVVKGLAMKKYGKAPEIVAVYLDAPFHPLKYVAAIQRLQKEGCKAIAVDSMSHSWSGDGGYLDLKEAELDRMTRGDADKREKCAMAAAARTKPTTHGRLVDALIHASVPVILCFRAKEKTHFGEENNKTVIVKDAFSTPIQEEGLIYEMLISGEVHANDNGSGGYCRFRGTGVKATHPEILKLLPEESELFSFEHAEALAKWCAGGPGPGTHQPAVDPEIKRLKAELWKLTTTKHGGKPEGLELWLIGEGLMSDTEDLGTLSAKRLSEIIAAVPAKLATP